MCTHQGVKIRNPGAAVQEVQFPVPSTSSGPPQISRLLLCPHNLLVTSAHDRGLSFPPMWFLGAHCNLPVSLLLPNLPVQCLLLPSVSVRSFLCADESMHSSRLYSFVFFSSSFITVSALLWRILIESPLILLVG